MTKRDLVVRISRETGVTQKSVQTVIQKLLDNIVETLQNGSSIEFRNFGTFKVIVHKARRGINPNPPYQKIDIPAKKVVVFREGKTLHNLMKNMI